MGEYGCCLCFGVSGFQSRSGRVLETYAHAQVLTTLFLGVYGVPSTNMSLSSSAGVEYVFVTYNTARLARISEPAATLVFGLSNFSPR